MFSTRSRRASGKAAIGAVGSTLCLPAFIAMGPVQGERTFALQTSHEQQQQQRESQYSMSRRGSDENRARVINHDNNYPNNMRKPEGDEVDLEACKSSLPVHRTTSECLSEDSYIVFEGCEDSELDDDESSDNDEEWKVVNESMSKKVHFASDEELVVVHHMVMWSFAYRASRRGPWEQCVRDRARFRRRVDACEPVLAAILQADHRRRVYAERFADATPSPSVAAVGGEEQTTRRHRKRRRNGKKKRRNRRKDRR